MKSILSMRLKKISKSCRVKYFNASLFILRAWLKPRGHQVAGRLTGTKNDWRIRVGDYRIIYEVDDNVRIVKVMRVRDRREAYRIIGKQDYRERRIKYPDG